MNIFILDMDPVLAAQAHCDKHVVKMIVETAQLLSTAHHELASTASEIPNGIYRPTHRNHPCAIFARSNREAYSWVWNLGRALCLEFERRYHHEHKTRAVLEGPLVVSPETLSGLWNSRPDRAAFPQAMPPEFQIYGDPVTAYRNYYRTAKAHLLTYTGRTRPTWL